jgi:hypothetical protein
MHTTAEISKLAESTRPDQFIPVRKEDLFSALIQQGDLADPVQRELFWRFARVSLVAGANITNHRIPAHSETTPGVRNAGRSFFQRFLSPALQRGPFPELGS